VNVKVKIDTDRYLGPEQAAVRVKGGVGPRTENKARKMLSLGGVHNLTGGSRRGRRNCETLLAMLIAKPSSWRRRWLERARQATSRRSSTARSGAALRVGCGSDRIGMFEPGKMKDISTEVIVVDQ